MYIFHPLISIYDNNTQIKKQKSYALDDVLFHKIFSTPSPHLKNWYWVILYKELYIIFTLTGTSLTFRFLISTVKSAKKVDIRETGLLVVKLFTINFLDIPVSIVLTCSSWQFSSHFNYSHVTLEKQLFLYFNQWLSICDF